MTQDSREDDDASAVSRAEKLITQEGLLDVTIQRQPSGLGHEGDFAVGTDFDDAEEPQIITKIVRTADVAEFNPFAVSQNKATLKVINPKYKRNGNPEKMAMMIMGNPTIGATVENPPNCSTTIPVPGYTNFLSDPVFVKQHHQVVNGKILRWRVETMNLISQLVHEGKFKESELLDQFIFARTDAYEVMTGLANHTTLPAGCLNHYALRNYFKGIDSREKADLLHQMSVAHTYEIIVHVKQVKDSNYREVQVLTRFNGWLIRAYGFRAKDGRTKVFGEEAFKRTYNADLNNV